MLQCERAAIFCALVDQQTALNAGLTPADFSSFDGVALWRVIMNRVTSGEAVDLVTVISDLGDQYRELVGQIMTETYSPANMRAYAKLVRQEKKRRDLQAITAKLDTEGDPDEAAGQALSQLIELTQTSGTRSMSMADLMSEMVNEIERAQELAKAGETIGVPTGLSALDHTLGGWHRSDLTVVAGRPAVGKTAALLSSALGAARKGYRVGVVSAEMSAIQLAQRAIAGASGVSGGKIRNGDLSDTDFTAMTESMNKLAQLPVEILDPDSCRPSDILSQAHVWQAKGLDVLFVDYLQLLKPDEPDQSRAREVGEMAKQLKAIAKALGLPVVSLAQVSRRCEQRNDKRPVLDDLRDSGEIEEAADAVVFLYRDAVHDPNADERRGEMIVAKNRHGPIGGLTVQYIPHRLMWCDADMAVE